ncbi:hypothetical protein GCM10010246_17610 [Streptomyces cuspidosporus]|uniref:Uncharacterized protein n=1 Tax=Streptomyces cuspidosporus TaxID=66882 RepID=A0ABN3FNJ4_9ACTN
MRPTRCSGSYALRHAQPVLTVAGQRRILTGFPRSDADEVFTDTLSGADPGPSTAVGTAGPAPPGRARTLRVGLGPPDPLADRAAVRAGAGALLLRAPGGGCD